MRRAFPDFWPVEVSYWRSEERREGGLVDSVTNPVQLNWHLDCHKLFLLYRDTLQSSWGS